MNHPDPHHRRICWDIDEIDIAQIDADGPLGDECPRRNDHIAIRLYCNCAESFLAEQAVGQIEDRRVGRFDAANLDRTGRGKSQTTPCSGSVCAQIELVDVRRGQSLEAHRTRIAEFQAGLTDTSLQPTAARDINHRAFADICLAGRDPDPATRYGRQIGLRARCDIVDPATADIEDRIRGQRQHVAIRQRDVASSNADRAIHQRRRRKAGVCSQIQFSARRQFECGIANEFERFVIENGDAAEPGPTEIFRPQIGGAGPAAGHNAVS